MESIRELRQICQRLHSDDWSARIVRAVSIYFTYVFIRLGISANAASVLNVIVGIAAGVALALPGPILLMVGVTLFTLNSILDGVDGELARYYRKSSLTGLFLDRLNSVFAYPAVFFGITLRLLPDAHILVVTAGFIAAWSSIALRLVKTTVDTSVIDAIVSASKAKQEAPATPTGSVVPLEGLLREKGSRLLWLVDFFTIRQPGFNIVLLLFAGASLLWTGMEIRPDLNLGPWELFVLGYAVTYTVALVVGIVLIVRRNMVEGKLQRVLASNRGQQ